MGLSQKEQDLIRSHLGRVPNEIETRIFENLWSEHCSYRHSRVFVKRYAKTHQFGALGVGENAGGVVLPSGKEVFFKIESHNHPSFIEPREGAATGVGGILRDVFAMGARPIMIGDLLCFGDPQKDNQQDRWMRRLVRGVVDGISSYGNSIGIANAGGDTKFHPSYQKNILVNVFALGIRDTGIRDTASPISSKIDPKHFGKTLDIHVIGGLTGVDGIGGAAMASETFSEKSDGGAAHQKRHHVQIGDPYMGKRIMEISLALQKHIVALQDCGAAGLTSSLFEVCDKNECGATIHLDRVPLRNPDLKPEDIMVSESQERMIVIALPETSAEITDICEHWDVPHGVIGQMYFNTKHMAIYYKDQQLTRCDTQFVCHGHLHLYDHIQCRAKSSSFLKSSVFLSSPRRRGPTLIAQEEWTPAFAGVTKEGDFQKTDISPQIPKPVVAENETIDMIEYSTDLVSSLAGCDRSWIFEKYDQHVGGRTHLSPHDHPVSVHIASESISDDASEVVGVRLSQAPELYAVSPYVASWQLVREGVMQLWAIGLTPMGLTNGLNFASPENPAVLESMDQATLGLTDACMQYKLPIVSGNVSLYNQSEGIAIAPNVALGFVGAAQLSDVRMHAKHLQQEMDVYAIRCASTSVFANPKTLTASTFEQCMRMDESYEKGVKEIFNTTSVVRAFFPYIKPLWDSFLPWLLKSSGYSANLRIGAHALAIGYGEIWCVVSKGQPVKAGAGTIVEKIGEMYSATTQTCQVTLDGKKFSLDMGNLRHAFTSTFSQKVLAS